MSDGDRSKRYVDALLDAAALFIDDHGDVDRLSDLCGVARTAFGCDAAAIHRSVGGAFSLVAVAGELAGPSAVSHRPDDPLPRRLAEAAGRAVVEERPVEGYATVLRSPLVGDGSLLGWLTIACRNPLPVDERAVQVGQGLARLAGGLLERGERRRVRQEWAHAAHAAEEDRRALLARDLRAALRDRRRLSAQLHDGPQQLLLSIGMRLRLLEDQAPDALRTELQELSRQAAAARDELRALSLEFGASVGHDRVAAGLRELLEANAAVAGWTTTFREAGLDEVPDHVYVTVLRIARDALGLIRDRTTARHVSVDIGEADGAAVLAVSTDRTDGVAAGVGPPPALVSIRDRAALVGGRAETTRHPGGGASVRVWIPLGPQPPSTSSTSTGSSSTNTEPAGSPAR